MPGAASRRAAARVAASFETLSVIAGGHGGGL